MEKLAFTIEQFSDKYKDEVIDVIGQTLADIHVVPHENLPIDDPDLQNINDVYKGKSKFWIALQDGHVIGTVAIRDMGDDVAKLNRMFVRIGLHGSGVGQSLLDQAITYAKQHGFKKIILNTHELMHRAHRFYEKNGFIRIGKTQEKFNYERVL